MPPVGGISQIAVAFEDGQRILLALKVPDIPEVKAQYESSKRVLALKIASLRDMESGLSSGSQTLLAQAATELLEANKQAGEVRRAIELLMEKYKITDADVNYRFRDKE